MKIRQVIYYCLLSLLPAIIVSAQNDLRFEYEYSDIRGQIVDAEVLLTKPSGKVQ